MYSRHIWSQKKLTIEEQLRTLQLNIREKSHTYILYYIPVSSKKVFSKLFFLQAGAAICWFLKNLNNRLRCVIPIFCFSLCPSGSVGLWVATDDTETHTHTLDKISLIKLNSVYLKVANKILFLNIKMFKAMHAIVKSLKN